MKALSMTQPWAQAIFLGYKRFETRSWATKYRGPLLIHAAKNFPKYAREFAAIERAVGRGNARIPGGALIGKVELVRICRVEELIGHISGLEHRYGDYSPGRYAWEFVNPQLLVEPMPYRGALGLFNVDETTLNLVFEPDIPERMDRKDEVN
jgi:hypothetical protein